MTVKICIIVPLQRFVLELSTNWNLRMETIDGFNQNLITQSKACLIVVMLEKVNIQNSYY